MKRLEIEMDMEGVSLRSTDSQGTAWMRLS